MEEIKFRVYDKEEKCFHYFTLTNILQYKKEFEKHIINGDKFDLFVGLKDKNGKEIYEGDIVNFEHYNKIFKDKIYYIIYENCNFVIKSKEGDNFWIGSKSILNIEIIGNIHENPELIKEVK